MHNKTNNVCAINVAIATLMLRANVDDLARHQWRTKQTSSMQRNKKIEEKLFIYIFYANFCNQLSVILFQRKSFIIFALHSIRTQHAQYSDCAHLAWRTILQRDMYVYNILTEIK